MTRSLVCILLLAAGQAWGCADTRKYSPDEVRQFQEREARETARIRRELAEAEKRARTPQEREEAQRRAKFELEKVLDENPLRSKCAR